jgi:hypothetical protein
VKKPARKPIRKTRSTSAVKKKSSSVAGRLHDKKKPLTP